MEFCYIDESGSAELLTVDRPDATPLFVLGGLIVPAERQRGLIWDFLQLKKTFRPNLRKSQLSDVIRQEVKGSDLRSDMRSESRDRRRGATRFTNKVFDLVVSHDCRLIARVIVKQPEVETSDVKIYTSSMSWLATTFNAYAASRNREGFLILDSRTKSKNAPSVAGITTQKYKVGGDPFPHIPEVPVFGHSDTHVGLQLIDIIASAAIFPASCAAFCTGLVGNSHNHARYQDVRNEFGPRLRDAQFRYRDETRDMWRGGIYANGHGNIRTTEIFEDRLPFPPKDET